VARHTQDAHLFELAKRGAQAQLSDLMHEVKMLLELFPHLRDSIDKDELPIAFLLKKAGKKNAAASIGADAAPVKKKRKLSAAARKAISDAQKRRWALQKSGKPGDKKK
jgi:hypothetical protein